MKCLSNRLLYADYYRYYGRQRLVERRMVGNRPYALRKETLADYHEANRSSVAGVSYPVTPDYDASYSYDLNGNIKSIYRKGMTDIQTISGRKYVTFGDVDRLTLSYSGNMLRSVKDAAPKVYYTGATDFDDGADEDTEYEYDYNGNMTADRNRGIVGIVYNSQNLPVRVEFADGAEIENMYDTDGVLLQRKLSGVSDAYGTDVRVTDYSGVWEYENGGLDRIHIPGGYIKDGTVYYHITDHQGNVRQVWDATSDAVVQENHYYPYGSLFGESASVEHQNAMSQTADNPYRYGGKEWLTHGGLNHYDFAARMYDPSLGRFNRPDPLNSDYPHLSPYLYCAGNPINATDPTGLKWNLEYLSDAEKESLEEIWSRFADNDNKELDFLYNLIEESEKTFYIQFKESLQTVSVGGDIYNPTISFVANKRGGGVLSISKSNPPHLQNFAEELFHCYQHSEMNLFTTDYNFEFEVKLFASIVHRRNPLGGDMMSAAVENLIEYLGVQQYVAYNPQFVVNLNSDKFNEIYQKGLELFVHNNNQNDTGNDNYRVPGSMLAKPVNLKEFYSKFFNKK